jgi:choice-of-anchor B domain-containing protein
MKKILLLAVSILSLTFKAQTYPSQNISLLALIHPNTGTVGIGPDDRRYSGVWGWKQTSTNKEYAIAGSSSGTYFIDVTNPSTPSVSAFVPGKPGCTWREIKTYQNYCYVVSDDFSPNTFQIIDMSTLPATVTVVHNGTTYFERGHTIWIDNNKMYIGSASYAGGSGFSSMNVYSLATPTAPALLRSLNQDYNFIQHVHDMYVRNDTVFASCGTQGLYIFQLTAANTFTQLGSYTNYSAGSAYNHASFLTADAKKLIFCDEVPGALPIRIVDVQNFSNIQPVLTWNPHPQTTPHNPYVIGNQWAIVSCYQDGLIIYDISSPTNTTSAGYFDTYPQGGFNTGNYNGADYRGNWGAYPWLPSGIIIAGDMQNGIFILDPTAAYNNPVGVKKNSPSNANLIFYPNPANDKISLHYNTTNDSYVEIRNMLGQLVYEKRFSGMVHEYVHVNQFANGTYIISLTENDQTVTKKLIVNH